MKELDPLLHSQLRLAVVSILMSVDEADFVYLRQETESTAGNLSVQLDKLSEAGYIATQRVLDGKKTRTVCRMTKKGRKAFEDYVEALKSYLNISAKAKKGK
jgi:DNA-binding MarR family transcriptional regulator